MSKIRGKLVQFHFRIPFRRFNPDARPFLSILIPYLYDVGGAGPRIGGVVEARDKDKRRGVADDGMMVSD